MPQPLLRLADLEDETGLAGERGFGAFAGGVELKAPVAQG
jgi:hypothetical protein